MLFCTQLMPVDVLGNGWILRNGGAPSDLCSWLLNGYIEKRQRSPQEALSHDNRKTGRCKQTDAGRDEGPVNLGQEPKPVKDQEITGL